jgi:small conductance mechanosensitive channel
MLQINTDTLTHRFTGYAYHWIITTGPKIIIAVVVFFIGQWIIKFLNRNLKRILSNRRFDATLRPFIQNLVQTTLQILLIFGIMQILGIKMTLFAAVIAAFGVAAGLALSGTLQNFASGVLIILLKPFIVGDNIKTQGEEGTVMAIRLFYTVVRTFSNVTLIVPNSKLSNEVIFNNTRETTRRLDTSIKFSYSVDFSEIDSIVKQTINSFEPGLKDPAARIGIENVEPDGYTVTINVWIQSHGFQDTILNFNKTLMENLKPIFTKS